LGGEQKVENRWDRWCSMGVRRGVQNGHSPWKLGLRTKNLYKTYIPIN